MVDLDALLDRFVAACLEVFGSERVEAVVAHGSAIKGGDITGYSDVDFMVFLTPDCFDERGELADDDVFAVQERIGAIPWQDAGFLHGQAYFYDARRLPDWWTGPAPGSYRELHGRMPLDVLPTVERLRAIEARYPDAEGPPLARRFYENVARLYGGSFDLELGRETFRAGVRFLRWAHRVAMA